MSVMMVCTLSGCIMNIPYSILGVPNSPYNSYSMILMTTALYGSADDSRLISFQSICS